MLSRKILQAPPTPPSPSPETDLGAGIVVTVLVLSVAVILSASIYLLLRLLRRYRHRSSSASVNYEHHRPVNIRQVLPVVKNNSMIEALPLFTFNSIAGGNNGGDCAVCLSKFEPEDLLRLLPVCCHAFHAECIDTWFGLNHSCPLCRSPIFVSDAELIAKFSLLSQSSISSSLASTSRSFRVEIGNVSRRVPNSGEIRRSYSIGDDFDYFVDDGIAEVPAGSFRIQTEFKVEPTAPPLEEFEALAAEVGPRGGWLTEYLSCSSRAPSFRSSGRWFFTGSGRRSEQQQQNREPELDVEASELGNNIGEYFRWLSGV